MPQSAKPATYRDAHIERDSLKPGDTVCGPTVIYQFDATTFIDQGWTAGVDTYLNLIVQPAQG
jgi:N-methylhydantoinase A/oxoprolinase/acetone carboxylase beta subunit